MLEIGVIDTGIGIKKQEQVKLFKMFGKILSEKDSDRCGVGIGLSVCKRIVNIFEG